MTCFTIPILKCEDYAFDLSMHCDKSFWKWWLVLQFRFWIARIMHSTRAQIVISCFENDDLFYDSDFELRGLCIWLEHFHGYSLHNMHDSWLVLDYNEEVHRSKNLREWSNAIGYKMVTSLAGVYTTTKTSLVENSKHGWKSEMVANMATRFSRGESFLEVKFVGQLQTLGQESWSPKNSNLRHFWNTFPSFPTYQCCLKWHCPGLKFLINQCTSLP